MSLIELTKKLLTFVSITPNDDGALTFIEQFLVECGFKVIIKEFGPKAVRNLYAYIGSKQSDLCFAGHIDVVPAGAEELWNYPPFAAIENEGRIYGRGTVDMKGALAAMLLALKNFALTEAANCSILITADEEGPAEFGTQAMLAWLKAHGYHQDLVLVGEPTNKQALGDTIKIGRRGSINFNLRIKGIQGHVAYPKQCLNPNHLMVQCLHALLVEEFDQGTADFLPSSLQLTSIDTDNEVTNVIPHYSFSKFNIRFSPIYSAAQLIEKIQAIISKFTNDFTLSSKISALPFLNQDLAFAEQFAKIVTSNTGLNPDFSTDGGTSDARFFYHEARSVIEFGLLSATAHQINEYLVIEDLKKLYNIYYESLVKICGCGETGRRSRLRI